MSDNFTRSLQKIFYYLILPIIFLKVLIATYRQTKMVNTNT